MKKHLGMIILVVLFIAVMLFVAAKFLGGKTKTNPATPSVWSNPHPAAAAVTTLNITPSLKKSLLAPVASFVRR